MRLLNSNTIISTVSVHIVQEDVRNSSAEIRRPRDKEKLRVSSSFRVRAKTGLFPAEIQMQACPLLVETKEAGWLVMINHPERW